MPTDWESRYQVGDTPWEKGEASPGLVDFLQSHLELARGEVLVPGCGNGHDARVWAKAGFAVTGCDLASSAVTNSREKTLAAGLQAEFFQGDFLRDAPTRLFDWIFEHTLFCAIEPSDRELYVNAAVRWLKPDGNFLAVYYVIPDTDGPPFGTTREEIFDRFAPHFTAIAEWVPRSYENRTGLELMIWWRRGV